MRTFHLQLTIDLVIRCLVLSFATRSTVAPAVVTDFAASHADTSRTQSQFVGGGGRVLRFSRHSRQSPRSFSKLTSTAHDRLRTSGIGRLRHRGLLASRTYRRPSDDVITLSGGSGDIRTGGDDSAAATARRRLPDVIIIGAKKSGTRALLEFLKIHPDVRAAGPETHFFDRFYDRGLDWYRSLMPATTSGQLTVEKTPSYLVSTRVVERIFAMDPSVRLLVVVRDPVTRAVSDYTQAASKRPDIAPFEQLAFVARNFTNSNLGCWTANETGACQVNTSWGAIRISLYLRHLSRWLRHFPRYQIHFVHGERLVADPAGQMKLVEQFLGLRPAINETNFQLDPVKGFPCIARSSTPLSPDAVVPRPPRCLGKAKGRTHRKVDDAAVCLLREFFRPFNRQFYRVVGTDFGWS